MTPELRSAVYLNKLNLVYFKHYLVLQSHHCSRLQELGEQAERTRKHTGNHSDFWNSRSLFLFKFIEICTSHDGLAWLCWVIEAYFVFIVSCVLGKCFTCHPIDTAVPCRFVGRFRNLARASCLHRLLYKKLILKMEGADSSRVFVPIDQTSSWIIPQDRRVWFVSVWWR
jgi:hypothetical protein